jgi:pimeloyl-ACP methyl ester carboxylesterase
MTDPIRPFTIDVPEAELGELRRRLDRVRWPAEPASGAEQYGTERATVQQLVDHWRDGYDWRTWETRLNSYPQFTTEIDGTTIHFLHVTSPEPDATALILTHGWPGSVAEFLDLIGPLTDPRGHGLHDGQAFHLVIPSLPGFGWSGPTPDAGWGPRRIARALAVLMERLGYSSYGAAGNDWGAVISPEIGRVAPDRVIGVHVTQAFSLPDGELPYYPPSVEPAERAGLSPDDAEELDGVRWCQREFGSYHHVHAQKPLTLGYALADSPVGLLAWNHQCMGDLDSDAILTHVSIHWFTGTGGSAIRIYADDEREETAAGPTTVAFGLAAFAQDLGGIRRYAERDHANIVSWNRYDVGGHYAARQEPEMLIKDLREFFAARKAATE